MKLKLKMAALSVFSLVAVAGSANAAPTLQIVDAAGILRSATQQEHTADPGGSIYPWAGGPGPGAGIPWQSPNGAGWPTGPGMGPDVGPPGFEGLGTSGWHNSYLLLTKAADVTFQFMGAGNSSRANSFWLDTNGATAGGWVQLFQDGQSSNPTFPCAAGAGGISCIGAAGFPNQNQYTFALPAGLIPFAFDVDGRVSGGVPQGPINDINDTWAFDGDIPCTGNPDTTSPNQCAGFFLGADPYLVNANHVSSGLRAVYAGLTDLPCSPTAGCDHDFQDMGVRISVVPEPGSLALLGLALSGLAFSRRRKSV